MKSLLLLPLILLMGCTRTSAPEGKYAGARNSEIGMGGTEISLRFKEIDGRFSFDGTAGYQNTPAVNPDFYGVLIREVAGERIYSFEDSFGNTGTMIAAKKESEYLVSIDIAQTLETRCLPLYGEYKIRKVPNQSLQTTTRTVPFGDAIASGRVASDL